MMALTDADAREMAIDIGGSFAVQAPAGSGKTELLSLRFLRLLAVSEKPEEVLAITFTRKAANEMAERILNTLEWAAAKDSEPELNTQLDKDRFAAAQSVLQQDRRLGWQLQLSPHRLRIQTIDSFCHFLANRMPILSHLGGPVTGTDQVDDCYEQAIRDFLSLLDQNHNVSASIAKLLLYFDNDVVKVEALLLELLKQREQWIEAVVDVASSPDAALAYLLSNVTELIEESLDKARQLLLPFAGQLLGLARYAAENLNQAGNTSPISQCLQLQELPGPHAKNLMQWCALVELLLVKSIAKPAWRRSVNQAQGFPAPSRSNEKQQQRKQKKQEMTKLLSALAASEGLLEALNYIRRLPSAAADDSSWEFLQSLTAILPTLLAQLDIAFASNNKVDYPLVSHAALKALGSDQNPTDLALTLDYQIRHILVDEFQDTSSIQLNLLHKLTAGWEPDDGRTLFIVGDAMQSCYLFRNANVGLFIAVREIGIRDIAVTAVDLCANFRSDAGVVNWVNRIFANSFPAVNDISRGAVRYSPSTAIHPEKIATPVTTRCYLYTEDGKTEAYAQEAAFIASEITQLQQLHPDHSIAILVRSRSHLVHVLPALRNANLSWQATEIDKLDTLPIITDLLSLTKALCNQADRLSWLAILRAPWCGISLDDLHLVATWNNQASVLENLSSMLNDDACRELSAWARRRLQQITPILINGVQIREQIHLSRLVRIVFTQLGGNAVVQSALEASSIERYFGLVGITEFAGSINDLAEFERRVQKTFVTDDGISENRNPVQIMTIHKAKGLEFDHVFLPGLARQNRVDEKALLLSHERLNRAGESRLFLATLSGTGHKNNTLYDLLRYEKAEKARFENIRLLYIGVTRARKSAYLSAALQSKEDASSVPSARSLLHTIWDSLQANSRADVGFIFVPVQPISTIRDKIQNPLQRAGVISRLRLDASSTTDSPLHPPHSPEETEVSSQMPLADPPHGEAGQPLQIHIGNLIHEALQNYLHNKALLEEDAIGKQRLRWRNYLSAYGLDRRESDKAIDVIEKSLRATITDAKLSWIFDHDLRDSAAEFAMQSSTHGTVRNHVLDRTFIDDEGYRWIIDYKSAIKPESQSLENFIDQQTMLYTDQLRRYRALFVQEDNAGIKTALLFTSLPLLVETAT